jgi:hypothetical protein
MEIIPPHPPLLKGGEFKVPPFRTQADSPRRRKRGIQGDFQVKNGGYNLYRPGNMVIYLSFSGMCR